MSAAMFTVGTKALLGTHTFTADGIKDFARKYDPQPFHLDEEAAKNSHFGALAASGWQTASLCMRFIVLYRRQQLEDLAARGETVPKFGPSPGIKDLKWLRPVFVGDTITYETEVVSVRPSSKPGRMIASSRNTGTNQNGVLVFEFTGSVLVYADQ